MGMEVELTNILFDKGTLMDLYIGRWAAIKKMQPTDMLMEKVDNDAVYLGHKKLLPKKAMEELVHLEGKARTALSKKSIDFPVGGGRFVYYKALPELLKTLDELKKQWDVEVEKLLADYPNLREQQLKVLEKQAEVWMNSDLDKSPDQAARSIRYNYLQSWLAKQKAENEQLYPSVEELKTKFHFDWRMFKVSALQGLEKMSTLDADELIAAQEKLRADLQKWVTEAATEMHKVLGQAAAQAVSLLDKQGKLNPKNLKPLWDAFETFKAIDFTGQSNFQETIEKVKKDFGVETNGAVDYEKTADKLNYSDYAKANLKELLSKMSTLAVDEVAAEAGKEAISKVGEFSRFVEV